MTNAYVYKITNKINNTFYFGYRYRNQTLKINPVDDIWINYFTSSNRMKKEILKYGKHNFTAEIIFESVDSLECWKQEQIVIKQHWGDTLLLNGKYHDPFSNKEYHRRINITSEKTRLKMSASRKGKPKTLEHRQKIAKSNTGQIGSAQKRQKLSEARKGKTPHNKGKSPPKFECIHCKKIASNANINKWHNNNCKTINPEKHYENATQIRNLWQIRTQCLTGGIRTPDMLGRSQLL